MDLRRDPTDPESPAGTGAGCGATCAGGTEGASCATTPNSSAAEWSPDGPWDPRWPVPPIDPWPWPSPDPFPQPDLGPEPAPTTCRAADANDWANCWAACDADPDRPCVFGCEWVPVAPGVCALMVSCGPCPDDTGEEEVESSGGDDENTPVGGW